jgi:putative SOS response-associated peptidase YedK
MCNLYSMTTNQKAIRDLFKVTRDTTGNLPPLPAIFPDQLASVVRVNEGERELTIMRWGHAEPAADSRHNDEHPQHQFAALA